MELFFNLDGIIYKPFTKEQEEGEHMQLGSVLLAELKAPIEPEVIPSLEALKKDGHYCYIVSGRGKRFEDEVNITRGKIKTDGVTKYIEAMTFRAPDKITAIKYIREQLPIKLESDGLEVRQIDYDKCILIDKDPEEVLAASLADIHGILFNEDAKNDPENFEFAKDQPKFHMATSWDEVLDTIKEISLNCQDEKNK